MILRFQKNKKGKYTLKIKIYNKCNMCLISMRFKCTA